MKLGLREVKRLPQAHKSNKETECFSFLINFFLLYQGFSIFYFFLLSHEIFFKSDLTT